jgi:hypothetical protein
VADQRSQSPPWGWAELLNGVHQGRHGERIVRDFVNDLGVSILPVDAAVPNGPPRCRRSTPARVPAASDGAFARRTR